MKLNLQNLDQNNNNEEYRRSFLIDEFPQIMKMKDAAKYLQFNYFVFGKFVREGKVPGFKCGRQWRFHKDQLDEFVRKMSAMNLNKG